VRSAGFTRVRTVLLKEMPLEAFTQKLPEAITLQAAIEYLQGERVTVRSNGGFASFEFCGNTNTEKATSMALAQLVYDAIERSRKHVVFDQIAACSGANVTIKLGVLNDAIRSSKVSEENRQSLLTLSDIIDAKRKASSPVYEGFGA
jgi:hypothetical protein